MDFRTGEWSVLCTSSSRRSTWTLPSYWQHLSGTECKPEHCEVQFHLHSQQARLLTCGTTCQLTPAKARPGQISSSESAAGVSFSLVKAGGLQNNDAVEDLLIARADTNYAPAGFEPPLCVAIRHRMGEIAKTLLTYTADMTVRGHLPPGSAEDGILGPTVADISAGDRAMLLLLRAHHRSHTAHCPIEEVE